MKYFNYVNWKSMVLPDRRRGRGGWEEGWFNEAKKSASPTGTSRICNKSQKCNEGVFLKNNSLKIGGRGPSKTYT